MLGRSVEAVGLETGHANRPKAPPPHLRNWLLSTYSGPHWAYYAGALINGESATHRAVSERLTSWCPPPAKVLDFGTGEGALAARFSDLGYATDAADIDRAQSPALQGLRFWQLREGIALAQSIAERDYDAVVAVEVLEHVENPWRTVRELAALLRPGGYLFVTTPNITNHASRLRFLALGDFRLFGPVPDRERYAHPHITPLPWFLLEALGARAGLENVEMATCGTLPLFEFGLGLVRGTLEGIGRLLCLTVGWLIRRRAPLFGICLLAVFRKPEEDQ